MPFDEEERNLTVKLFIQTRLQIENFIHCLNCDQRLTSPNEFRVFVDRPCEILITPKLFRYTGNGSKEYGPACKSSFLKIRVIKSTAISWAAFAFAWTSFGLLIFSFYPQIVWSFLRSDTSGICQDYLVLSAFGFFSSAIFHFAFFFSAVLKTEFYRNYPLQQYPAHLSDIISSCHQVLAITILISQSLLYRTSQPLSNCGLTLLMCNLSPMIVLVVFVALKKFLLIDFLNFVNFVRLVALSFRYLPQVSHRSMGSLLTRAIDHDQTMIIVCRLAMVFTFFSIFQITYNINRDSTYGFSRVYLFCDFLGSLFSVIQIVLVIINLSKLKSFY